ncbi:MAG: T9SS type A sorting domain-containing protein [Bacteroidales bacterium]|nr:T9SS type A sorting domain-containing protein [Bacteroidales bacterium]
MSKLKKLFLVLLVAIASPIFSVAQQTDVTLYYRNSATETIENVSKFSFNGENLVLQFADGSLAEYPVVEIKKMTLSHIPQEVGIAVEDGVLAGEGLYPNPVTEMLFLSVDAREGAEYHIFSAVGQLVKDGIYTPQTPIDVAELKAGMYILKIDNKTFKFNKL